MKEKKARGRPKQSNSRKNCIKSWVNDDENSRLSEGLSLMKMSRSEFVRVAISEKLDRILPGYSDSYDEYYDDYDTYDEDDE